MVAIATIQNEGKDERRYTIFRADETDSDSADEEYMCASE